MMDGLLIRWQSSVCPCSFVRMSGLYQWPQPCDAEHKIWCGRIGEEEADRIEGMAEKAVRKGLPKNFLHILERYEKRDNTFHRPREVIFCPDALAADMGFFLHESLGVALWLCKEPERYATLLSGKASQGLTEKMWQQDWLGERFFLPEEFFLSGDADRAALESMFRPLDAEVLWAVARSDEEVLGGDR